MKEKYITTIMAIAAVSMLSGCAEKWTMRKFDNQDGKLYEVDLLSGKAQKIEDTEPNESRARHIIADVLCTLPGNPPPDDTEVPVFKSKPVSVPINTNEAKLKSEKELIVKDGKDDNCVVFTAQTYGGWKTNAGSYLWGVYNRTQNQYFFFNTSGETLLGGITKYSGPATINAVGQVISASVLDPSEVNLRSGEVFQGQAVILNKEQKKKDEKIRKPH